MRSRLRYADRDQLRQRLRRHVDVLADLIGPRHLDVGDSLGLAAEYVERELATFGTVQRQPYTVYGREVTNFVLEVPGERRADEIVVVGAHYDTIADTPGADDNASAVAVLLETVRLLHGMRPARTVRLVAFTCEEPPHFYTHTMGSRVYAARCRERAENITAMICLEMVGYFTSQPDTQKLPKSVAWLLRWLVPSRGNFIAAVGNLRSSSLSWEFWEGFRSGTRLPIRFVALPEVVHAIRLSDNSSFWDHGYPALMITDTSFLRNPHYHRPSDTADTLDYAAMAEVAVGTAAAVARLAGKA